MIIRIVKMTFHPENVEVFKGLFEGVKDKITNFDGCQKVMLLKDTLNPSIFFTYSIWESTAKLNAYRKSAFFDETWHKTKALFSDKPEAWSLEEP